MKTGKYVLVSVVASLTLWLIFAAGGAQPPVVAQQWEASPNTFIPSTGAGSLSQPAAGWEIECVDCPKYFLDMTDRSLRLDAGGHPHIAYGGDALYYAWHDGSDWRLETVDSNPSVGEYAALALDGDNYPHISYFDRTNRDLKYAWQDAAGWHSETVDSAGYVGEYTSLALDGDNYPHISYFDQTNSDLKLAHFPVYVAYLPLVLRGMSVGP